jgi:hypothetical protein
MKTDTEVQLMLRSRMKGKTLEQAASSATSPAASMAARGVKRLV